MESVLIISWTILATIFFGFMTVVASFVEKNGNLPHKVISIWGKSIIFVSGARVKVRGLCNIDPEKSYIYMPNHQSLFDIPILTAYLKVQFRWLAKVELFHIPVFGQAMQHAGYISIDRTNRKAAFESLRKAAEIIRNGVSVLIFPEGTRSRDGISSFKKGGFVLAVDSGVPIIPIIIHGTREIMPKKKLSFKTGNVVVEVRPPVETSVYTRKNKDVLLENVRQVICKSFEKGN